MSDNTINNAPQPAEKETAVLAAEKTEKEPRRKREIIKTILILFLAGLLILTFFSNTIMNKSLAEITTEKVSSGKLTQRVRGSGMIESNRSYEVAVDGERIVDTVLIKEGQEVEKDDVLFTVVGKESAELEEANETLEGLEYEYQKMLVTAPEDYSTQNQSIKNAREDLSQAIAKRDKAYNSEAYYDQLRANLKTAKSDQTKYSAQKEKLSATISALDSNDYSMAAPELIGDMVSIYSAYTDAENEYQAAYTAYSQALETESENAEIAKADADAKEAARDAAKQYYEDSKSLVRSSLVGQLETAESDLASADSRVEEIEAELQDAPTMTYEECVADVQAKQRELESLIIELNKSQSENNMNGQLSDLELEAKKKAIEKQKKKIEELKKNSTATEVRAKYSGVVSRVDIKANDTLTPDMTAAVIDLADEGYTVKVSIEADKAKKVKTGAKADIVNYWGDPLEAVLTEIKSDPSGNSRNRELVFSITGNADSGTFIDLSIPCGSGTYDTIVPKSAVHHDNDGDFIMKVRSKSTPLGNRYYAERVGVEVLSSDEASMAVSGTLSPGEYVITACSKSVSPGDQVRMKDDD